MPVKPGNTHLPKSAGIPTDRTAPVTACGLSQADLEAEPGEHGISTDPAQVDCEGCQT